MRGNTESRYRTHRRARSRLPAGRKAVAAEVVLPGRSAVPERVAEKADHRRDRADDAPAHREPANSVKRGGAPAAAAPVARATDERPIRDPPGRIGTDRRAGRRDPPQGGARNDQGDGVDPAD